MSFFFHLEILEVFKESFRFPSFDLNHEYSSDI